MLFLKRTIILLILLTILNPLYSGELPGKTDIISTMQLVNDYWIAENSNPGNNGWAWAAYFTGNMAMYDIYPGKKYLDYAVYWSEQNNWAPGSRPRHADDHCCGQTYIDLFKIDSDTSRIVQIKQTIDNMVNTVKKDDWSWIDALYMDMPVFTRLGVLFNDNAYLDKMYDLYQDTKIRRALYDSTDGLWFRDKNYSAPEDTTSNGKKIYWSRGNGWVFGAHVRTLQLLPESDPHWEEYVNTFRKMASALKKAQRSDGFWGVSLADSAHYPGPETSGTGFFTYGLAWGINHGILDSTMYYPVVVNAWNGLVQKAVHPDGFLGYVQGVGSHPGSSQPVTYNTTRDFGVGAFLLAGSELFHLASGEIPVPEPEPENFALNNVINYSSQQADPYNPASNAVDGNEATRWSAQIFPQWIEIDLLEIKKINKIEIVPYQQRAYQYLIEAKKNDNDTYSTIIDKQSNTVGGLSIVDTLAINTRYIKLTVTGCSNYTGTWVSILEFKIFGETETGVSVPDHLNKIEGFDLSYAYPNPFNPSTLISFSLPKTNHVKLIVYDARGREIVTLVDDWRDAGTYKVHFDATNLPTGTYFYQLSAGGYTQTKKMTLMK